MSFLPSLFLLLGIVAFSSAGIPAPELFYDDQIVDHDNPDDLGRWSQRYYIWEYHFRGPGFPILVILGGEGSIDPTTGIVYPFVAEHLARDMGAFVLQPEHRFYGKSQPKPIGDLDDPREKLLTPKQALQDAMRLIEFYRERLPCSSDRSSQDYCPVITVGGSYPGFLSAMARLLFPQVVDMAYAASAPMKFYAQLTDVNAYYDHITAVAEKASPGCASVVREALDTVNNLILGSSNDSIDELAVELGFCSGSVPAYIDSVQTFADEIFMIFGYSTANDNMAYYPPTERTRLYGMCRLFDDSTKSATDKVKEFFLGRLAVEDNGCIAMTSQLPTGRNATISGGDWSGDGWGPSAESWDFQTCTLCVEKIGFSESSMYPKREWTLSWMERHCWDRFGVVPRPHKLADEWGFDDLAGKTNASRILFTNGLNDGWSVSGIKESLSPDLIALNFENGAHHSDLSGRGPTDEDTPDIQAGFRTIKNILFKWLFELRTESDRINVAEQ